MYKVTRSPRRACRVRLALVSAAILFALSVPLPLHARPGPPQDAQATVLKAKLDDVVEQVKERDAELLLRREVIARQRYMLVSLVLFTALLATSLAIFRVRDAARRRELGHELIRTRQQALSLQMNPHFIFNTLGSLQSFILKNDRSGSNLYLTKFSQLMRIVLEHLDRDEVALAEELDALRLYLDLQQMRFGDRFAHEIAIDPAIDLDSWRMPPFLVQPFVENAIHHGLLPKERRGRLRVAVESQADGVRWVIEDDGIGRAEAGKRTPPAADGSRPHGVDITRRRVDLANALTPGRIAVSTTDLHDPGGAPIGTRVSVVLTGGAA